MVWSNILLEDGLKYRVNERCSNNQAEQMAILKALEYIQYVKVGRKQP
jgi:ribonuclease HI